MKYKSTRTKDSPLLDSAEVILKGIADDGGLFVPETIPKVTLDEIKLLIDKNYCGRAVAILKKFLTDYDDFELNECVELAYDWFDVESKVPLTILISDEQHKDSPVGVMELYHGVSSAFKDMALQLLPRLMSKALKKVGETKEILILVATSGDTGKAALAGFADVPQTKIMVFYPAEGVSKIQKLQMVTQTGKNVNVTAVQGNFDDCQNGVKEIFANENIRAELDKLNVKLSSANSINWGRLVPQICYYFASYAEFVKSGSIKLGDSVNVAVPTGNFGNILAAYYAKKMGVPFKKLICASNINNVLTDFFNTGVYDRNREFHKTITPSMDILISSNLERLLYHETNGDTKRVKNFMQELNTKGKYKIDNSLKKKLDKIFYATYVTEEETTNIIKEIFDNYKYLVDTHTAVAMMSVGKYRRNTHDMSPVLVAATASPFKFTGAVLKALGQPVEGVDDLEQLDNLSFFTKKNVPKNLAALGTAKILHENICNKEDMAQAVLKFAAE